VRTNDLSITIAGFAGQGVKTAGAAFAKVCSRAGLHVFINEEYPSNIKGEHTYSQIMVSEQPVGAHSRVIDVLLALDKRSIATHQAALRPGGALIYDGADLAVSPVDKGLGDVAITRDDLLVMDLPLVEMAREVGGGHRMLNSVGLGAVQGLLRFDFDELARTMTRSLARLGDDLVQKNLAGARRSYDLALAEYSSRFDVLLQRCGGSKRMVLTGNDAIGLGILKAGVKLYSGYPMTPSSSVLSQMATHGRQFGMVSLLTEDEIAGLGMAIGAGFAGIRAMTGTSGGGFCLMSEYLGLAGMCEIPVVILEGQRPGPATGLPTRTEQGDLKFVLSAHQGDFPRIVIAPGTVHQAFEWAFESFNLAERYQTPVILLSDKHLGECSWTCEPFDTTGRAIDRGEVLTEQQVSKLEDFRRYLDTESGISPRVLPGTPGGVHRATGNEHTDHGYLSEASEDRVRQMKKRLRKLDSLDVSEIGVTFHGPEDADVTLVGWGSCSPVILEAMSLLERHGVVSNFLQVIFMSPFPTESVRQVLSKAKTTMAIENNATGQLADVITEKTALQVDHRVLKFDGRQFFRDELATMIEQRLAGPADASSGAGVES
jgi:2-oxoglutarate ferredoxin oxidoreductase subunit alpha